MGKFEITCNYEIVAKNGCIVCDVLMIPNGEMRFASYIMRHYHISCNINMHQLCICVCEIVNSSINGAV